MTYLNASDLATIKKAKHLCVNINHGAWASEPQVVPLQLTESYQRKCNRFLHNVEIGLAYARANTNTNTNANTNTSRKKLIVDAVHWRAGDRCIEHKVMGDSGACQAPDYWIQTVIQNGSSSIDQEFAESESEPPADLIYIATDSTDPR